MSFKSAKVVSRPSTTLSIPISSKNLTADELVTDICVETCTSSFKSILFARFIIYGSATIIAVTPASSNACKYSLMPSKLSWWRMILHVTWILAPYWFANCTASLMSSIEKLDACDRKENSLPPINTASAP